MCSPRYQIAVSHTANLTALLHEQYKPVWFVGPEFAVFTFINVRLWYSASSFRSDDTIREAILTCAQKLTRQLNLPHGTDNYKVRNRSGKKQICLEVSVNSPGNLWSRSWRGKGRLWWERFITTTCHRQVSIIFYTFSIAPKSSWFLAVVVKHFHEEHDTNDSIVIILLRALKYTDYCLHCRWCGWNEQY